MPSTADMRITLDDARFFYSLMDPIIRGPEVGQDLTMIRRYFRAYLYCWKSICHYVREVKGYGRDSKGWIAWWSRWETKTASLTSDDKAVAKLLREAHDDDTHNNCISTQREIAAGLFPIVMFELHAGERRELISTCARGLVLAEQLINTHADVV